MALTRYREAFDADRAFVTRRKLRLSGTDIPVGRVFDKTLVTTRRLQQMFNQRALGYPGESGRDTARPPNPRPAMGHGAPAAVKAVEANPPATADVPIVPAPEASAPETPAHATPPKTMQERLALEPRAPRTVVDPRDKSAIPSGWAKLAWPKRLQLASQFSDKRLVNGEDVRLTIEAELARRGTA